MSPVFTIVEGKHKHCGRIARILRREQQEECLRRNISIHAEIRAMFDSSYFRKAWLIDGRIAGLGGVQGSMMSPTGLVWVALSQEAMKYPVAIVKEARHQLEEIMLTKIELTTSVSFHDEAAQRFAAFLGFGVGGMPPAFSRAGRRTMIEQMNSEGAPRTFAGSHWQIAVSLQREVVHG